MQRHEVSAELAVAKVTLLEDRAHVSRRGAIDLEGGVTRVRIDEVSPIIADKSLIARCGDETVRVVDARVVRRAADTTTNKHLRDELRHEAEALEEQLARKQNDRTTDREQLELLDDLARVTLDEIAVDVAWGTAPDAATDGKLDELAGERRRLRAELVRHDRAVARLEAERERLSKRRRELDDPSATIEAWLEIDLHASAAGTHTFEIDYVVPGACWRPYHTAELGDAEVRFSTDGCVWQHTGEDWRDVELVFSTERASLGTEPPELTSDVLRVQRRATVLEVETRDTVVKEASAGGVTSEALPGIDDGGDPLALRASSRTTVVSDGRPHRVPLCTFTTAATTKLLCQAELDTAVLLVSTQTNAAPNPILAGPVDLIRGSGLCGKTSVLFIGPGEHFELGWGPETEVRAQRDVDITEHEAGLLSSWVESHHKIEVRLSNLGATARELVVRERIPVSEIAKVKVKPLPADTTERRMPDEDGFVEWHVSLPARGTACVVLKYVVEKHTDVVGL